MLDEIIKQLIAEAVEVEVEKIKKPVGSISDPLRLEYKQWKEDKEELEAEIKFKFERLRAKIERQLFEEYAPKLKQHEKKKEQLWEEIRKEVGLFGEESLNIDTSTGVISEWISKSKNIRF